MNNFLDSEPISDDISVSRPSEPSACSIIVERDPANRIGFHFERMIDRVRVDEVVLADPAFFLRLMDEVRKLAAASGLNSVFYAGPLDDVVYRCFLDYGFREDDQLTCNHFLYFDIAGGDADG